MIDCTTSHSPAISWLPLCSRYLVVCAGSLSLQVLTEESDTPLSVVWAVGALADGETEILGAWPSADEGRAAWDLFTADIRRRGVEQIRVLVTEDAGAQAADFPGKPTFVSRLACAPEPLSSLGLASRHRRIVKRTSLLADSSNATIVRRLSRMAPFSSAAAALALVAQSLVQAQRRIETSSDAFSGARRRPAGRLVPLAVTALGQVMPFAAKGLAR